MSQATEEAKKVVEEQRLKSNTAGWKLNDAGVALKAKKYRQATPAS